MKADEPGSLLEALLKFKDKDKDGDNKDKDGDNKDKDGDNKDKDGDNKDNNVSSCVHSPCHIMCKDCAYYLYVC